MSFAKLDHGIVKSSIWAEPLATRILWITMLAIKDENGFISAARSGLARIANISMDDFEVAIKCLESPDPDSRTSDNEGRRVEKAEGGWIILNDEKYRLPEDERREYMREYMQKYRACKVNNNLTKINSGLPSVSVSTSNSVSDINSEGGCKGETLFNDFWKLYPRKVGKIGTKKAWSKIKEPQKILELITKSLEWQIKSEQWTKDLGKFIPHPSTYLNDGRWMDEQQMNKPSTIKTGPRPY